MTDNPEMSFQRKSLFQQGYHHFSEAELAQLEWGLRFTPAVCASIAAVALYMQAPYALLVISFLGLYAFFFPAHHPMDLIYNHAVRHLFGAVALPENPLPRRMACLATGSMTLIAALLFLNDMPQLALVVGVALLCLQVVVITTHFCLMSWIYEYTMRALGMWEKAAPVDVARDWLKNGGVLVDVRSQNEHAADPVPNSVNLPLENLDDNLDEFRKIKAVLFCQSGARSHLAQNKLRNHGIEETVNLGARRRVDEL
ncbi:MAG: DUF4395 family protein [Rhodobacteraceae bacterium]|nr:DUF4395 family protein [Paracoccaceae bacterium]